MGDEPVKPTEIATMPDAAGVGAAAPESPETNTFTEALNKVESKVSEAVTAVRTKGRQATLDASEWLEKKEFVDDKETAQTAIPIAAAAAVGITSIAFYNTLTKIGKGITGGIRNLVTGFGHFENIPLVGGLFTFLGDAVDTIGEFSGAIITGALTILTFKAFQVPSAPESNERDGSAAASMGGAAAAALALGRMKAVPFDPEATTKRLSAAFSETDGPKASPKTMQQLEQVVGKEKLGAVREKFLGAPDAEFTENQAKALTQAWKEQDAALLKSKAVEIKTVRGEAKSPGLIRRGFHKITPGSRFIDRGFSAAMEAPARAEGAAIERIRAGNFDTMLEKLHGFAKAPAASPVATTPVATSAVPDYNYSGALRTGANGLPELSNGMPSTFLDPLNTGPGTSNSYPRQIGTGTIEPAIPETPVKPTPSAKTGPTTSGVRPGFGAAAGLTAGIQAVHVLTDENASGWEKASAGGGGAAGVTAIAADLAGAAKLAKGAGAVGILATAPLQVINAVQNFNDGNNLQGSIDAAYGAGGLMMLTPVTFVPGALTVIGAGATDIGHKTYQIVDMAVENSNTYDRIDSSYRLDPEKYKNLTILSLQGINMGNKDVWRKYESQFVRNENGNVDLDNPKNFAPLRGLIGETLEIHKKRMEENDSWAPRWLRSDKGVGDYTMAKGDCSTCEFALQELDLIEGKFKAREYEKSKLEHEQNKIRQEAPGNLRPSETPNLIAQSDKKDKDSPAPPKMG